MIFLLWELIHQIQHKLFENDPKAACADISLDGIESNSFECVIGEFQLHVLVLEQALVLLDERVLRSRENFNKGLLIQVVKRRNYGNAANELRDHAELDQVLRLDLFQKHGARVFRFGFNFAMEPHRAANCHSTLDHLVEPNERSTTYKEDVGGIDLRKLLMWMF